MTDRDDADGDTDHGDGFVFGEDRTRAEESPARPDAEESPAKPDTGDSTATSGVSTDTLTMAVVGVVAALLLLVAGAQLVAPGALADVLGGDDAGQPAVTTGATPTDVATSPTSGADTTDGVRDTDDALATATQNTRGQNTDGAPTATESGREANTPASDEPSDATTSGGTASTGIASGETTLDGTDGEGDGANGDGEGGDDNGFVQTDTGEGGPPSIDSVSVIDDSEAGGSGGTLVFEVGWTVTDPDGNLAGLTVTVLDDPGGDTTTLARRPLDIDGARNQSTTTFQAPIDSLGGPYEIRVVAEDQFGNSVNVTRREVANGESD